MRISPEEGLVRAKRRGICDNFEQESAEFFSRDSQMYQDRLKAMPYARQIDATLSPSAVIEAITFDLNDFIHDYAFT